MAGKQSMLGQTLSNGSGGVGFSFRIVNITEIHPDTNICVGSDIRTAEEFQVGMNKRGSSSVWPQPGDKWLIDRSLGHWALRCKITDTQAPSYTGNSSTMDKDLLRLVGLLKGMGVIQDSTTSGSVPIVTGSRSNMSPGLVSLIGILAATGVLVDNTTAPPIPVQTWRYPSFLASGFTQWTAATVPRYMLCPDNTVLVEGRLVAPSTAPPGGVILFTIEAAVAPPTTKYFTTTTSVGVAAELLVETGGNVKLWDWGSTTPVKVQLDMRYSLVP
jgi:uncharacterized membrane protein